MKFIPVLIFLTLNFYGRSQTNEELLYKAFNRNSTKLLNEFFNNWNLEIKPIDDIELVSLNDTIENSYKIFQEFINWKNINNKNYKYVLIQNEIKIFIAEQVYFTNENIDSLIFEKIYADDTLSQTLKEQYSKKNSGQYSDFVREIYAPNFNEISKPFLFKTEINFRPNIKSTNSILYLNNEYSNLLHKYLTTEPTEKKKEFLNNNIEIFKGFIGNWEFKPYTMSSITIDKNMKYAKINYGVGEIIYLKNENGMWKFIQHELEFVR